MTFVCHNWISRRGHLCTVIMTVTNVTAPCRVTRRQYRQEGTKDEYLRDVVSSPWSYYMVARWSIDYDHNAPTLLTHGGARRQCIKRLPNLCTQDPRNSPLRRVRGGTLVGQCKLISRATIWVGLHPWSSRHSGLIMHCACPSTHNIRCNVFVHNFLTRVNWCRRSSRPLQHGTDILLISDVSSSVVGQGKVSRAPHMITAWSVFCLCVCAI